MMLKDEPTLLDEFREFQTLYKIDADKPPFYHDAEDCIDANCKEHHAGCDETCEVCHEECSDHPCEDCLGTMIDRAMDMQDMER